MKHIKLFEGFLSEKKKQKKKDKDEDPGTVLSNTTGIIATGEVTEKMSSKNDLGIEYKTDKDKFFKRNPKGGKWVEISKSEYDLKKSTKEDYVKEIKNSLEDYQSQGGRIGKTLIKAAVEGMEIGDKSLEKEVQKELENIFL